MAFKRNKRANTAINTPETLYANLGNRVFKELLLHQAELVKEYAEKHIKTPDIAIQLPTGGGKTLVGLLIAEWRRQKYKERVVYLCPNKQLVNQTINESLHKYGINCNSFLGSRHSFSNTLKSQYIDRDVLAVSTYSSLFNINSFFKDNQADVIIFDDAHASENYISKYWSLNIKRSDNPQLFGNILTIIKVFLSNEDILTLNSNTPDISDFHWTQKLPTASFYEIQADLIQLLDEYVSHDDANSDIKYPWFTIRPHLFACHFYISYNSILIRPLIPPTFSHEGFINAKQRVYMSATLGEGGDLERLTGVKKIERLPVPEGWDKQGIGRRFFAFPEKSLSEDDTEELIFKCLPKKPRTLFLVPTLKEASERSHVLREKGYTTFENTQIEESKADFVEANHAVAVLANKYDGIDFPGEECRLLIINNIQKTTNLQERFLVTRLAASILLNDRILTRIVQAVGRCTRSLTDGSADYSAVIVFGEDISRIISDKKCFLHPELQAEIEFGIEESKDSSVDNFIENIDIFLEHGDNWKDVEQDIIDIRKDLKQEKLPGVEKLRASVEHEVRYQQYMWNKNYIAALDECESVLSNLSGDEVKGYRAFWNYLAGSAAWLSTQDELSNTEVKARDFFKKAANIAPEVSWFMKLSKLSMNTESESKIDNEILILIENLEQQIIRMGTSNNRVFEKEVKYIQDNINKEITEDMDDTMRGKCSRLFESAQVKLGKLLGYKADNSETQADPDPWWIASENSCIVFETHSSATSDTLGATKVRQAASHPNWIKSKINDLDDSAEIISILISPCKYLNSGSEPHAKEVLYWHLDDFKTWANNAVNTIRELRTEFSEEADLIWRKKAMQAYRDNRLDPKSLIKDCQNTPLSDLPIKKPKS